MPKGIFFTSLFLLTTYANANENFVFSTGVDTLEQGISEVVIQEAYQQIAINVEIEHYPNMRSLMMSNNGEVDGELARISHINERFKNLLQVPVVINHIDGYAFSTKKDLLVLNWESLRDYELVCLTGLLFVERNLSQRNIPCYSVSTYSQIINLLQIGRFDAAILPEITGLRVIKSNQAKDVYMQERPLIRVELYHYLNKKHQSILPEITTILQRMKNSGRIEEIRDEYLLSQNIIAGSGLN